MIPILILAVVFLLIISALSSAQQRRYNNLLQRILQLEEKLDALGSKVGENRLLIENNKENINKNLKKEPQ